MSKRSNPELGDDICVTCGSDLVEGQYGYCDDCLNEQLLEHELDVLPSYSPAWLEKYSQSRRIEIEKFVNKDNIRMAAIIEVLGKTNEMNVFAILSPELAANLDYGLIREVARIEPATPSDKEFLKNYWLKKYEIDVPEFDYKVGLVFRWGNEDYSTYSVYDYPSSLISTFAIKEDVKHE